MEKFTLILNGQVVTTDLLIAKAFSRTPSSIRRTIKNLECSDEFRANNFAQTSYLDQQGKKQPSYKITKDGFVLLVMGFTGKQATEFKIQYIEAFNEMEKHMNNAYQQFNTVCKRFNQRKDGVSDSARDMVTWKHEKPILERILADLRNELQLSLFNDETKEGAQ